MMSTQDRLASFLRRHVQWPVSPYYVLTDQPVIVLRRGDQLQAYYSAEDLGEALLHAAEAEGFRIGGYLRTPLGHILAAAVEEVVPSGYRPAYELAVGGLTRAAELQQRGQWEQARRVLGRTAVGAGVAFVIAAMVYSE